MGFKETFESLREQFWDQVKRYSRMLMIVGSMLLFLFGLFFLIAGAYFGATFTTQIEQGAVIASCSCGALLVVFSILGAITVRKGHGVFTYLLFAFAFGLFIAGLIVVGMALTYLNRLKAISGVPTPPFPFSQNITDPKLQEVSDYVNSIYTFCCTGCTAAICGQKIEETPYCIQQLTLPQPPCKFVVPCPETQGNDPNCFFSRNEEGTVPPIEIPPNMCDFLKNSGWGEFNTPVVGNIGTDPRRVSCGGGDPKVFAFALKDWLFQQYAWISALIGLILFLLIVVMVATLAYDRNERENYKAPRVQECV